ncbi:squalene/phytoene synthase family protein [uncultured Cohaesibacter sp.]|uniref:squalene/phytoene synthase family protein n=1 Tax=uncultured Cohaesibacter sp. TaxID=1002546 RepID=UPI002AAA74AF|nr:squalene/phytoene synthase family protein [uncultured Cohaesibacter sp.]
MSGSEDVFSFCQSELKALSPVSHFAALTAPQDKRPALMALYAFLVTLRRIPAQVSSKEMGEIRLQWWRDILSDTQSNFADGCGLDNIGPLATALKQTQRQFQLPSDQLEAIVDAHSLDLAPGSMPDGNTYDSYARSTKGMRLALACRILNDGQSPDHLAQLFITAGKAISLAEHLRTWPEAAKAKQLFLPLDMFENFGLSEQDLYASPHSKQSAEAIKALCQNASDLHKETLEALKDIKEGGQAHLAPAFMALGPVPLILKKRQRRPHDHLEISNWRSYWCIWRMARKF